jgi:hypothetical protein
MRRVDLLLVCLALAGCAGDVSDKKALEAYFKERPDPTILSNPGPIRSVECHMTGLTFHRSQVYVCDVHYEQADGLVCGARVNGKIVTTGLPRCFP